MLCEPSASWPAKCPKKRLDSALVLPPFWKALWPIAMFLLVLLPKPACWPAQLPIKNPWRSLPSVSNSPASLPILINCVLKSTLSSIVAIPVTVRFLVVDAWLTLICSNCADVELKSLYVAPTPERALIIPTLLCRLRVSVMSVT